jgi:ribonucleoside-diphosphate reductase alpha chain
VGGGMIKIVNNTMPEALAKLGYSDDQIKAISDYVHTEETIEGAPGLKDEHLAVFDCAFRAANGTRSIDYMGHIRMMAAAQPFISGAISKTVNLPTDATIEDVQDAYLESWKQGLKAVAIYRDGCKRTQPLSTSKTDPGLAKANGAGTAIAEVPVKNGPPAAVRRKLPDERQSLTHKFSIAGHEGYIHVGLYETGEPGEIFVKMAKEGSTISGLMDSFATAISLALQHGVPLRLIVDKFSRTRFEPYGFTENPEIPRASSIMDYLFRWLGSKFVKREPEVEAEPVAAATPEIERVAEVVAQGANLKVEVVDATNGTNGHKNGNGHTTVAGNGNYSFIARTDAPTCPECGSIMIPNGSCHKCVNCGTTSGCS